MLSRQGVKLEIIRDILKCAPTALALLGGPGHELSREALSSSNGGPSAPPGAGPASGPVTPPLVFVLDFVGDVKASRVTQLAAEISALLSLPPEARPSEVVLRIKSPGGSVTGYGLASAEVERLVAGGIALTVCVDEVPAPRIPPPACYFFICIFYFVKGCCFGRVLDGLRRNNDLLLAVRRHRLDWSRPNGPKRREAHAHRRDRSF